MHIENGTTVFGGGRAALAGRPILLFATAAAVLSCGDVLGQAPEMRFELAIRVVSDDGRPLAGAQVVTSPKEVVRTDETGEALISVAGREGDRRAFNVTCPSDFEASSVPLVIALHKNADAAKRPVYRATCSPLRRTAVVAVRAENGPNLPVLYLGEEVARTDSLGAAHVLLHIAPGDAFRITLDTSHNPSLRPLSPSAEYTVGSSDDLFFFDAKLTVDAPKAPPPPRVRTRRPGPTPL
jgi:hypothetical protein